MATFSLTLLLGHSIGIIMCIMRDISDKIIYIVCIIISVNLPVNVNYRITKKGCMIWNNAFLGFRIPVISGHNSWIYLCKSLKRVLSVSSDRSYNLHKCNTNNMLFVYVVLIYNGWTSTMRKIISELYVILSNTCIDIIYIVFPLKWLYR